MTRVVSRVVSCVVSAVVSCVVSSEVCCSGFSVGCFVIVPFFRVVSVLFPFCVRLCVLCCRVPWLPIFVLVVPLSGG